MDPLEHAKKNALLNIVFKNNEDSGKKTKQLLERWYVIFWMESSGLVQLRNTTSTRKL